MNDQTQWMAVNEQYLSATMDWLRLKLRRAAGTGEYPAAEKKTYRWFRRGKQELQLSKEPEPFPIAVLPYDEELDQARRKMERLESEVPPPALILLANRLGLSQFDRQVLALCAAMELDTRVASLCALAQADPVRPYPTFALAFALFDDPDWNALSPHSPLRYWRLLEIHQPGVQPLTAAALGADERIVHYLKGLNYLDDRLVPLVDRLGVVFGDGELPPSQQQTAKHIVRRLKASSGMERPPVIELLGHDSSSKYVVAGYVAASLGLNLYAIDLKILPGQTGDFETFLRLWQRESLLMAQALYIQVDSTGDVESVRLKRFLERGSGVVFLDLEDAKTETVRNRITFEIDKPTPQEQAQIWREALENQADHMPERLVEQFSFGQNEIHHLAGLVLNEKQDETPPSGSELGDELWQACRIAARAGMEQLARRIDAKATWDQLVLPHELKALLRQITDQVTQRSRVYEAWGFRATMNRGLGINALFAGDSGTGKTMAAEVIANELELDLFRIDLSAVVSKFIGETEKNLRKLFDAAEDSGAILFFDEADALFGKRSEVKDSHDRYANIEINYLLQRMEAYRGLAILATNMKGALDKAFARRLRFIVDFPFPGIEERKEIWQKIFPPATPLDGGLDYGRLAKLNLSGGNIHNVALNAAFLAAQAGTPVTMPLVLNAARTEFKKLERPAKESDFRWQGPTGVVV